MSARKKIANNREAWPLLSASACDAVAAGACTASAGSKIASRIGQPSICITPRRSNGSPDKTFSANSQAKTFW
jgi:hypothetical protein